MFELHSSAMFPIDDQAAFAEQDKLEFISLALQAERQFDDSFEGGAGADPSMQVHGSSERPFIRVSRGREFADAFSPDFFAKTFPSCFPYGRGGPQLADRNEAGEPENPLLRDMTLESWAKVVLQRHGGHCAQHPAFPCLQHACTVPEPVDRPGALEAVSFSTRRGNTPEVDGRAPTRGSEGDV